MSPPRDSLAVDLERASMLCYLQRHADATAAAAEIIAANPDCADAWCLRARAEIGLGNAEPAVEAATTAIGLAPESEWPHRLASVAFADLGRPRDAIWHAREAPRLDPHSWRAHSHLAKMLAARTDHLAEARAAADRAVTLAPNESDAHIAVGSVAAADKRRRDADAAFRRALTLDPQSSVAHNELARLQLRRRNIANPGGMANAAAGFATAVRANPRAAVSRHNFDLVLRGFLARVAYFIFLDAFFLARPDVTSNQLTLRLLPIAALVVPLAFAARFVAGLTPQLRRHLLDLLRHERVIGLAVALESIAVACLVAGACASGGPQRGLILGAAAAGGIGRLILLSRARASARAARAAGGETERPRRSPMFAWLATATLWLLAASLGLTALTLAYATATGHGGIDEILAASGLAAVLAAGAAGIATSLVRRRARRQQPARWSVKRRRPRGGPPAGARSPG